MSFLLTPLLWKLEKPLGLELAGHSGPAEGVIYAAVAIVWLISLGIWMALARRRGSRKNQGPGR